MAFTVSNATKTVFGNMNVYKGNWSGLAGDPPGTIVLGGGNVYLSEFTPDITAGPMQINAVPVSWSSTNGVLTATVYNTAAVASGTFLIIYA